MELPLLIMITQGVPGAFDTLYYHEYVYRLPVHGAAVRRELQLHALRDFVYGLLVLSRPFVTGQGTIVFLLLALIVLKICITIWDFNIEVIERASVVSPIKSEDSTSLWRSYTDSF